MKYLIIAAVASLSVASSVASAGIGCFVSDSTHGKVMQVYERDLPFSANKISHKSEGYELILSQTSVGFASADLRYRGKQILLGTMRILPGAYMSVLAMDDDGGHVDLSCLDMVK